MPSVPCLDPEWCDVIYSIHHKIQYVIPENRKGGRNKEKKWRKEEKKRKKGKKIKSDICHQDHYYNFGVFTFSFCFLCSFYVAVTVVYMRLYFLLFSLHYVVLSFFFNIAWSTWPLFLMTGSYSVESSFKFFWLQVMHFPYFSCTYDKFPEVWFLGQRKWMFVWLLILFPNFKPRDFILEVNISFSF